MPFIKHRPGAVVAICTLIVIGIFCLVLRTIWFKSGGIPADDKVWQLTFEFQFRAPQGGSIVYIALPVDTPQARVLAQNYYYPELRQGRLKDRKGDIREAAFIAPKEGRFFLKAEYQIHFSPTAKWVRDSKAAALSAESRNLYLSGETHIQIDNEPVKNVFLQLFSKASDKNRLLDLIADFCEKKIATESVKGPGDAVGVLASRKASLVGRARTMIAFCRLGKIPARLVSGFILKESPEAYSHFWIEVFIDGKWLPFDPENGYRRQLPIYFVPVRRGGSEIIRIKGGSNIDHKYTLAHIATPHGLISAEEKSLIEIIDLTRLPLSTQSTLIVLLMLPVGALLTTLFRNIIGVRTFGVFTPTLLALATVYADWRTVTIIFVIVVVTGIGGRALLPGLKLMQVPRLSIVFTVVAFTMTLTVSTLEYINFNPAGHLVLLPLVVLTTIIDRVYSVTDDNGLHTALLRLGWTIVVAFICVWIFRWQLIGRLLLIYPEIHFISLALLIWMGLYNRRKLTDFSYFHFFTEAQAKEEKISKNTPDEG